MSSICCKLQEQGGSHQQRIAVNWQHIKGLVSVYRMRLSWSFSCARQSHIQKCVQNNLITNQILCTVNHCMWFCPKPTFSWLNINNHYFLMLGNYCFDIMDLWICSTSIEIVLVWPVTIIYQLCWVTIFQRQTLTTQSIFLITVNLLWQWFQ